MSALQRRLLSVQQTAEYLGLAVSTVYNRCGRKSKNPFPVRPKRIGKSVKFDIRDLDKFLDTI